MGLSAFGYMAALLPNVPPKLAGMAMLPALEEPLMAGTGEPLVLAPAMPIKEGKAAELPGLTEPKTEPLRTLNTSVSLHVSCLSGHHFHTLYGSAMLTCCILELKRHCKFACQKWDCAKYCLKARESSIWAEPPL